MTFSLLLIGGPGTGKTRTGLELIDALDGRGVVTDTERGTQAYKKMFKFQYGEELEHCDSFTTTRRIIAGLCKEPKCPDGRDCLLYFLDSASPLWTDVQVQAEAYNMAKRKKHQFESGMNIGLWGTIKREHKKFVMDLRRLSMPVIVTARQKEVWEGPEDNQKLIGFKPECEKSFEHEFDISLRLFMSVKGEYMVEVRKARGVYGDILGPTGTKLDKPLVELLRECHDWGEDVVVPTAGATDEQTETFTILVKELGLTAKQVAAALKQRKVARFEDLSPEQAEEVIKSLEAKVAEAPKEEVSL